MRECLLKKILLELEEVFMKFYDNGLIDIMSMNIFYYLIDQSI